VPGDEIKTVYALEMMKENKPRFMTIHLSSLDEEEHLHGPFSVEANEDLEKLDGMVGRLVEQERKNDPEAVVVVVSDHGFADIDHMLNVGVAFVEAGLMPADGRKGVWEAQPWSLGCMLAIMLRDPSDEVVKAKVKALLEKLAADPANGVESVLDPAQVKVRGGVPEASFVLTLRKGFVPGPGLSGPLVVAVAGHRGTHGYDPATTPEMRASFFATGRSVAKGKNLGVVDMRQVAPTVAAVLGVKLPDVNEEALALR